MTFHWSATPEGKNLKIKVRFGGGGATDNEATANVLWGSIQAVKINGGSAEISVSGDISVSWGADDSYVVTFLGQMVRPHYVNILTGPLIVSAYLSHTTAEADGSE
jgi:hypothetical protein